MKGADCSKCVNNNIKKTTSEFIEDAREIHGNKYDYSLCEYINTDTIVDIICVKHGIFKQRPHGHLKGDGCPKCGREIVADKERKSLSKFIEDSREVHGNKYDYSFAEYKTNTDQILIICKMHGVFFQTAISHISGSDCPKCAFKGYSKKSIKWLNYISKKDNINIQHAENGGEYKICGSGYNYRVDGYCKNTNTIYEFHGSYYHGDPVIYDYDNFNKLQNIKMGELYDKTIERENKIKELGYNLVVIWEREWDKLYKDIKRTI